MLGGYSVNFMKCVTLSIAQVVVRGPIIMMMALVNGAMGIAAKTVE